MASSSALAVVHDANVNVVTWASAVSRRDLGRLEERALDLHVDRTADIDANAPSAAELIEELEPGPWRDLLGRTIERLATAMAVAMAPLHRGTLRARLESVAREICPRLHADWVIARGLCTFWGPGTLWVDNEDVKVDPRAVCGRDFEAINRRVAEPSRVRQAAAGDLILLKGAAWPGTLCGGAVHKAPPLEARGSRLVLKLDIPARE